MHLENAMKCRHRLMSLTVIHLGRKDMCNGQSEEWQELPASGMTSGHYLALNRLLSPACLLANSPAANLAGQRLASVNKFWSLYVSKTSS